MKKTLTMLTAAGVAAAIAAAPAGAAKPTTPKAPSASKQCQTEKTAMGAATFKLTYGTNANRSNAMGKCVSQQRNDQATTAKQVKADTAAEISAAKSCKTEKQADADAFATKYGTNANHRNAFGKCVSTLAKQKSQDTSAS
jgi:hypothetical protein